MSAGWIIALVLVFTFGVFVGLFAAALAAACKPARNEDLEQ